MAGKKPDPKSQRDRFAEAARELGCDEDQEAFDKALKKVATASKAIVHKSDCAMHDAPAYKAGACTCGAAKKAKARR
jgi:hypothetical protein